jgi:sugar lactone lactonase YvrE
MWPPRRWIDRDALSRYWNALVTGAPDDVLAPLAAALDEEQLAVIARLRSRQRHQPDPAFVARLERELLRDLPIAGASSVPLLTVTPPTANGGIPPRSFGVPPIGEPHRWSLTPVINALLVIITLLAVYLAVIRPLEPPVVIPIVAPEATPATPAVEASPVPGATPEVPFWRTVPPPQVGASVVWQIDGPQSTGTGLSSQLSVDPNGNLWVMDGANGRFQIYNKDGDRVDTWGQAGSGEGQFDFQRSNGEVVGNLAFTPLHADEPFYVADSQNARIQVFDKDHNFLRSWGTRGTGDGQFLEPVSVWVSFEGLVFVLDDQRADVQIFDPDGTFIRKLGGPGTGDGQFNHPGWGAISDHGIYWVADIGNHRLQEFNCCNPELEPYVYVATIDGAGSNESQLDQPQFLAFDQDFRVYVVDRGHRRVAIFLEDGRFVNLIDGSKAGGTAFVNPGGVALSREGLDSFLYVLDDDGTSVIVQKFRLILP